MCRRIYAVVASGLLGLVVGTGSHQAAAAWANPGLLLGAEEVQKNAEKADWIVVDCRSLEDYAKGHIPGAISLGKPCSKALRDPTARLFTDVAKYESLLGKVGIGNNSHVVFYHGDMKTFNNATVAFWIMEYLGHDKAHVLNGGMDAWRKAGYRLDAQPARRDPATYKVKAVTSRYASTQEVLKIAAGKAKDVQLVDSRTNKEHKGEDIRALRGGHVPYTTVNVSHLDTLPRVKDPKTDKMVEIAYLDPDLTAKAFGKLDKSKRTIAYCQTGTRSTLTYLQLRLLGFKQPANWDDSWTVYGSQLAYPVADEQWFNFAAVNSKIKQLEQKHAEIEAASQKTASK